jgi:hypothetical protein
VITSLNFKPIVAESEPHHFVKPEPHYLVVPEPHHLVVTEPAPAQTFNFERCKKRTEN